MNPRAADSGLQAVAAANNAAWCDLVCRTHGLETGFGDDMWTSRSRTPPYYPDAVTLAPDPAIPDLLARIDSSSGCSVKDSFASLDLATHGFEVLFETKWLVRMPVPDQTLAPVVTWSTVEDVATFAVWEQAWQRHHEEGGVLRPDLLDVDSVTVMAEWDEGRVIAGAVLNRAFHVIGISNFFADFDTASASWEGCIEFARTLFPESTLVGYEADPALFAARSKGFETVGPLRVWIRP